MADEALYQQTGVVTDLARLLRARHWARDLKLFSRSAARSMLLGETRSRYRGRGMEFEEVRRYQAGDDIRTIDWKVSARAGTTYTKLFCEERERPVHILVDQRSSLFFGSQRQFKSVLAAELGTAIAWAALAGSDRVGGQVIGDIEESESRARRNKQAVLRLIHDLHAFNHQLLEANAELATDSTAQPRRALSTSLQECRRIARPGTAIFIISDFADFDEAAAKALSRLGRHTDLTLLQVTDALEEQLPIIAGAPISDGIHRRQVNINHTLKSSYQQQRIEQQAMLKSAAVRARALFAKIDTSQSARDGLVKIFGS